MTDWLTGPDPSDPPEDDDLLATVNAAIGLLADKLLHEPELKRMDAMAFVKAVAPDCSLFFGAVIWPEARRLAGLPASAGKGGRPKKPDVSFSRFR